MFATKDIDVGDLVCAERPLVVYPRKFTTHYAMEDPSLPVPPESMNESLTRLLIAKMGEKEKEAFWELSDWRADAVGKSKTAEGIVLTNVYGLEFEEKGPPPTSSP